MAIFQLFDPKKGPKSKDMKNSRIRIFGTYPKNVYADSWENSVKIQGLDRFFDKKKLLIFRKNRHFWPKSTIFLVKILILTLF